MRTIRLPSLGLVMILAVTAWLPAFAADAGPGARPAARSSDPQLETIVLGTGCFWGAEKFMGMLPGVVDIEVGYANGDEGVPGNYQAVLAHERALREGKTKARNHAEVAKITFDPDQVSLEGVLARFWEIHDPTQVDQQGPDVGTNYRSAIYTVDQQLKSCPRFCSPPKHKIIKPWASLKRKWTRSSSCRANPPSPQTWTCPACYTRASSEVHMHMHASRRSIQAKLVN